ncbi:MAG: 7-cyano-7-deazaguanine synthase QueC [Planctomycetaceae bacterium]|jgi:7-cyano-7-deazaguanine synthase|nr:7-cyano-7-deazaguanine synthase QueC [Planctomycetaceae bacterium]
MTRAVVLLSGGLDSTTVAAIAKADGHDLYALTVDYNQRHRVELQAARRVAEFFAVKRHVIAPIDLRQFGGSSLTSDWEVSKIQSVADIGKKIPNTYVPARNTIFLSLALAFAETVDARQIYIGVTAVDYSGYPDCRPEFIEAFERTANLATKAGIEHSPFKIAAPLILMHKKDIIQWGLALGVDYSLTHTCYDPLPDGTACGRCESCQLRLKAFAELSIADPVRYT